MKKIYLVVTTVQGTIEAFLIPHIKLLEEMGYEVWIAARKDKEISHELKNNKFININFKRNPFSLNTIKAFKELKNLMNKNKFEGIHCHTPIAAFLTRLSAKLTGQKNIIYTAHGFHFFKGAPFINWLVYYPIEKLAARWTDKLITINEEDYKRAKKIVLSKTKVYKMNGVGLDLSKYNSGDGKKIRNEFDLKNDDFVISIIGELNSNKNQIQIIKAVELLKKEQIEVKLLIVGVGEKEEKLKKYVDSKCLNENIHFLGYRRDINDIVAASDILTSMSYREGLPRNIMEGMAQGKPFIATNIRGNRDIIKNNQNGYLVELNNIEQVKNRIKQILNKNVYETMRQNNLKSNEKFSVFKILEELKMIYEK